MPKKLSEQLCAKPDSKPVTGRSVQSGAQSLKDLQSGLLGQPTIIQTLDEARGDLLATDPPLENAGKRTRVEGVEQRVY